MRSSWEAERLKPLRRERVGRVQRERGAKAVAILAACGIRSVAVLTNR